MTARKARTVLITGAAVRLGEAVAHALAADGWNIVIHYRRSKKPAEALARALARTKRSVTLAQADLNDPASVAKLIPSLARAGVHLDALINNASVFEKDNLAGLSPALWQEHMNVNLLAPLLLMRDFAAQYKGREGNVINITDGMVGWSVSPTFLSYSLSKLGLCSATELLARELAPRIRVNAIAPGSTLKGKQDKEDTYAKLRKIIPLRRTSSPEEICAAVRYILSAPSLTGQVITLSGGMHIRGL